MTVSGKKLTKRELRILEHARNCETNSSTGTFEGVWMRRSGKGFWRFYAAGIGGCGSAVMGLAERGYLKIAYGNQTSIDADATLTPAGRSALASGGKS